MRQVDQKDQAEEEEKCGSDQGNIVTPEHEERFRNKEGDHNQGQPGNEFRTPEAVLNCSTGILRRVDTKEKDSHYDVKDAKRKVDPVNSDPAITVPIRTTNFHVIQRQVL